MDGDTGIVAIKGIEVREALDVIPVGVAQKDLDLPLSAVDDGSAQSADASPGIDNDSLPVGLYLQTWGIAPLTQLRGGGHGKGSTHAPECHLHSSKFPLLTQ